MEKNIKLKFDRINDLHPNDTNIAYKAGFNDAIIIVLDILKDDNE